MGGSARFFIFSIFERAIFEITGAVVAIWWVTAEQANSLREPARMGRWKIDFARATP
jgi:hypothetical protein